MSTTFYLKYGSSYKIASKEELDMHDMLPAANYVLCADPTGNLFLKTIDSFEITHKLYGNISRHSQRILHTFLDRGSSTGVLLAGEKGSGKSLLAKNIVIEAAAKQKIPTIVINAPWKGDAFNALLQHITQPCIVLFDEFEKVYDKDDQQQILTLLDGVFPTKKLFLLTCNDKWRIDINMRNRPGRIFYMLDFNGLDPSFIKEYCEDNLKNKGHIAKLLQVVSTFDVFNFDMLKAVVEEMNRFNEPVNEAIRMLNAKPEFGGKSTYKIKLMIEGKDITKKGQQDTFHGNPLFEAFGIPLLVTIKEDDGTEYDDYENIVFNPADLKIVDGTGSKLIFTNEDGVTVVLTKQYAKETSYLDLF